MTKTICSAKTVSARQPVANASTRMKAKTTAPSRPSALFVPLRLYRKKGEKRVRAAEAAILNLEQRPSTEESKAEMLLSLDRPLPRTTQQIFRERAASLDHRIHAVYISRADQQGPRTRHLAESLPVLSRGRLRVALRASRLPQMAKLTWSSISCENRA